MFPVLDSGKFQSIKQINLTDPKTLKTSEIQNDSDIFYSLLHKQALLIKLLHGFALAPPWQHHDITSIPTCNSTLTRILLTNQAAIFPLKKKILDFHMQLTHLK